MKPTELTYGQLKNQKSAMALINLFSISAAVRDTFQFQSIRIISTCSMVKDEFDRQLVLKAAGIYSTYVFPTISSEKINDRLKDGSKSIIE